MHIHGVHMHIHGYTHTLHTNEHIDTLRERYMIQYSLECSFLCVHGVFSFFQICGLKKSYDAGISEIALILSQDY